jgi:hypothetical protein
MGGGEQPPELIGKPVRRVQLAQPQHAQQEQRAPPQHQPQKQRDWQPKRKQQEQQWQSQPRRQSGKQRFDKGLAIQYNRQITQQSSISKIMQLVQAAQREGALDAINLVAALDRTVQLDKQARSPSGDGVAAWAELRPLSMTLLQKLDSRALVALLRAAAHFGTFSADELKAWQAASSSPLQHAMAIDASNGLLSLSTLAAGSEELKAAVDASLVVRLVQRWLHLVPDMLSLNVSQGLYGAACLGYPFSQQELDHITQQALEDDGRFEAANGAQLFRAWSLLDAAWREWEFRRQQSAVAAASRLQPQALYPGNAAVEEALLRVLSLGLGEQAASQILLSVGQLHFRPSAGAAAALVDGERLTVPAAWLAVEAWWM